MYRVLVAIALAGCGPSAAQIKAANEATYTAPAQDVFAISEKVTAESYTIGERMPDEHVFATQPIWFTDAGRTQRGSDDEHKKAGHIQLSLAVLVAADANKTKVVVSATALDYEPGKGEPRTLDSRDELPPWINQRVDRLRVAIHKRLSAAAK